MATDSDEIDPFTRLLGLARQGRTTISLGQLSQRISFPASNQAGRATWRELLNATEPQLPLILMLLASHELASRPGPENTSAEIVEISKGFAGALPRLKPLAKSNSSFENLAVATAEIYTHV